MHDCCTPGRGPDDDLRVKTDTTGEQANVHVGPAEQRCVLVEEKWHVFCDIRTSEGVTTVERTIGRTISDAIKKTTNIFDFLGQWHGIALPSTISPATSSITVVEKEQERTPLSLPLCSHYPRYSEQPRNRRPHNFSLVGLHHVPWLIFP